MKSKNFVLINGYLYLNDKEGNHKRVFHSEQRDIMEIEASNFHKSNHFGMKKFEVMCKEYFFKIPRDIIRKVVSSCTVCTQAQPLKVKEKQKHITASRPMERLMIDLIDLKCYKEKNSNYAWILTVIDVYSKFAWAFPLFKKTGKEVAEVLENLFLTFGPPQILQSDNGKEFINQHMKELLDHFVVIFLHSRPRHPQTNGQIERFNQTLTRFLQKFIFEKECFENVKDKPWKVFLGKVVHNYNISTHSATNKSPFRLFLNIPGFNTVATEKNDIVKPIQESSDGNFDLDLLSEEPKDGNDMIREISISPKYLDRMDRNSSVHLSKYDFEVGDKVIVAKDFDTNTKTKKKKLSSFYSNISEIEKLISNNRAIINTENGVQNEVVHLSRLKKL